MLTYSLLLRLNSSTQLLSSFARAHGGIVTSSCRRYNTGLFPPTSNRFRNHQGLRCSNNWNVSSIAYSTPSLNNFASDEVQGAISFVNRPRGELSSELQDDETELSDDPLELTADEIWNATPTTTDRPVFTFAAFAAESDTIKKFLQLGVAIHSWEDKWAIPQLVMSLNFEKQVIPILRLLCDHGFERADLARFLTRNPHILKEDVKTLETRIKYLRSKKFTHEAISAIICRNPFWLSFSVERIDRRLGFFQQYFSLTGDQVRELACYGATLVTGKLGRVKDVTITIHERMGFEREDLRTLLLSTPGIFMIEPEVLWSRFDYLHNTMKFTHKQLLKFPAALRCRLSRLKQRIGFLQNVGRDQFDPRKPKYISLNDIIYGTDSDFATKVALSSALKYNEYLKSL